ncbi:TetR/AcrR family transcriptional regulator C-terminal domain-containing protein [Kribbella sp. VKM Ac-2568]|uniref:TetR/AcrR family transcriptional regulator C-terminal domain-containing protein n=1 Tax=Kribbella sp. VKM Ac-2568 TaxID=2512219 RepID=UPI0010D7A215|nr:TetR/AcrR family transcriptional regulator C-terminal domain-containing protein [Kribbella sp. VKM Ac-2568]TCM45711.1 hypothetical protein EV648_106173 [Kribbella sp. VKM Ac-2568]
MTRATWSCPAWTLADRLAAFAADGLLEVVDPLRAALRFSLLISGANPSYRGESLTTDEITESVTTGVHAFLHGYAR